MRIGIAGVGRMGSAIAERLLAQGKEVLVWNRTAGRTEPLVAKGARACATPAALTADADVILTILTDAAAIRTVYDGKDGILSAPLAGKLVVDMSTVRPETAKALAAQVTAQGAAFVECPVGGTVGPAREGKLFGFAGGSDADFARAKPLLDELCRRLEHVGPVGAGSAVKLAINLPLAVYWQVLGEALVLCRDVGLDGSRLVGIIADTSGGPTVLRNRAELVARVLDGEQATGTVDIDILRKDIGTMLEEAAGLGARLPVTEAAAAAYDESVSAGLGHLDAARQAAFWRDRD